MATNYNKLDLSGIGINYDDNKKSFNDSTNKGENSWDWRSKNGDELIKDARFMSKIRDYYGTGKDAWGFFDIEDDEDLIDVFLRDRYLKNWNTGGAAYELSKVNTDIGDTFSGLSNEDENETIEMMQHAYETMGNFWNDETGRAWMRFRNMAGNMILDPLNVIGFGAGAKVGANAYRAARLAGKSTKAAKWKATGAGAAKGAVVEGLVGVPAGGVMDLTIQARNKSLGLQDEIYQKQLIKAGAFGGLAGAGFGGVFGAAGGRFGARGAGKIKDKRYQTSSEFGDLQGNLTNTEFDAALQGRQDGTTMALPDMQPGRKLVEEAKSAEAKIKDMRVNPKDYEQEEVRSVIQRFSTIKALLELPKAIEDIKVKIKDTTDPDQRIALEDKLNVYETAHKKAMESRTVDEVDASLELINPNLKKPETETPDVINLGDETKPDVEAEATPEAETTGQRLLEDDEATEFYDALTKAREGADLGISKEELPAWWRQQIIDLDEKVISKENKQKVLDVHDATVKEAFDEEMDISGQEGLLPVKKNGRPKKLDLSRLSQDERQLFHDQVNDYMTKYKRGHPQASNFYLRQAEREYSEFALEKIITGKAENRSVKSNIGKFSGDTPENPLPEGAGRILVTEPNQTKSLGRTQSILRKGGSGGQFIGKTPVKSKVDLYKVQAIAEHKNIKGPIRFQWNGNKALKTADGDEVKKGGVAFYIDNPEPGIMGKVYKDVRKVTGEAGTAVEDLAVADIKTEDPNLKLLRVLQKKVDAGKGSTEDAAKLAELKSIYGDVAPPKSNTPEASLSELLKSTDTEVQSLATKLMEKLGKPVEPKTPKTTKAKPKADAVVDENAVEIPEGQVIALRNKKDPYDIRVQSIKQKDAGLNVSAVAGRAKLSDWDIGFVPEGMRNSDALENFKPLTKESIPDVDVNVKDSFESRGKPVEIKSHYNQSELSNIDVDISDLRSPDGTKSLADYFDSQTRNSLFNGNPDKRITADMGWRIADIYEGLAFAKWANNGDYLADTLHKLYARLPERKANTQSREAAIKQVRDIMSNASEEELNIVSRMFNAMNIDMFPVFRNWQDVVQKSNIPFDPTTVQGATIAPNIKMEGAGDIAINPYRTGEFDPNLDADVMLQAEDTASLNFQASQFYEDAWMNVPDRHAPSMMIAHEFAHWSYFNILDAKDKAIFHKSIQKYISDTPANTGKEKVNYASLMQKTYDADGYIGRGVIDSPQEFFANQFVLWVNGRKNIVGSDNYWASIYRKVKGMFNRLTNSEEALDPDLVPIFNKLLPEEKVITKATAKSTNPSADILQQQTWNMRLLNDDLKESIHTTQDPVLTYNYLSDLVRELTQVESQGAIDKKAYDPEFLNLIGATRDAVVTKLQAIKSYNKNDFSMIELGESNDLITFANDLSPTITEVINGLENSFGRANQTADAIPSINTNLLKDIKIKTNEELTTKQKLTNKIRRKRKADEKRLDRKVSKITKNAGNIPQREVDAADISNPRKMTHEILKQKFKDSDPSTLEGNAYGKELYRRLITKLPKPKATVVSREVMSMRKEDLINELQRALNNGDQGKKRFNEVYAEIYRRQISKNAKKGVFTVSNDKLINAIQEEAEEMIDVIDAGIHPVGVKQQKKQLLVKSTHRNPEVQGELRNFINKIVLLHGGNINYTRGGAIKQSKYKSSTLNEADRDFTTYAAGMQFETNAADFKLLRKLGRGVATQLVKDEPDVDNLMTMVNEAIMTTSFIDDYQREIIENVFVNQPMKRVKDIAKYQAKGGVVNDGSAIDVDARLASEEWFIDSMVKLQKGEISLADIADFDGRYTDEFQDVINNVDQAAAWFINGSLRSKKAKDQLTRVSLYGDPSFNSYQDLPILSDYAGVNSPVPVYIAKTVARQKIRSVLNDPKKTLNILNFIGRDAFTETKIKVYYHGTPQGSALSKKSNPDIMMDHGNGMFGPGFYVTDEPEVAGAFAGTNATKESKYSLADQYGDEGSWDIGLYQEARKEFDTVYSMGNKIGDEFQLESTQIALADQMADLNGEADRLLKKYGYKPEPTVLPVVARLRQGFDVRQEYDLNNRNVATDIEMKRIIDKAEEEGLIDPSGTLHMFDDPYEIISREEFYVRMIKLLNDDWNDNVDWYKQDLSRGKKRFTGLLQSLKYDHIIHTQPQMVKATGKKTLGDAYVIMNHGHVKHVDSKFFDQNSTKLYDEEMGAGSIAGSLLDAAQVDGALYSRRKLDGLMHSLEESGLPPELINSLNDIADGDVTASSIENTRKASFGGILHSNANRSRIESNSNFFSDWVKPLEGVGHYEKHNALAGDKFVPIMQMLHNLPDSYRWYERYVHKFKVWGDEPQPQSHKKILRALRYALDPEHRSVKALTKDERLVAEKVNQFFKDEHHWLTDSGVEMGEIKNYVPRVYNAEAIKKDMEGFVDKISSYLMREAAQDSRRLSLSQAVEKAKAIAMRITDDDGSYIPPFAEKKSPHSDNIDFQRMLKLSGKELEGMEPYLINDLTSVLSKYIDGSTRRGLFTQQWGYNNFGFDDYMRVGIEGAEGIANMLQSNKIAKVTLRYATDGGGMDEVTTPIPKLQVPRMFNGNPSQARLYANHIVDLVKAGKKAEAKAKLMEFEAESGDQWHHRVNAIVEGINDFGDEGGLTPKQVKFMLGQFRVIQRKPLDSSGTFYEKASITSKLLRNINAITLLSYTTLTSIPDVFLPLIRSGSMKSFIKGWKNFSTDKHYREMLSRTGLNIENISHDRLAGMYGSAGGRSANNFFHVTLLSQWTDTMRKLGGATGFETMRTMNRIAADLYRPDGKMPVKYRTAARILRQFGLEDYAKPDPETGRFKMIGEMGEMMGGTDSMRFREAMIKFANETIFAPNPNDNPLWSQTPIGSMIYQLKSFPVMMGKLTANVLKEAKQGNVSPLVYLMTVGTGLGGAGSLAMKDIVQFRGGEDQDKAQLRERLLTNISKEFGNKDGKIKWVDGLEKDLSSFVKEHPEMLSIALAAGYNPSMHGSVDSFFGWYIEALLQTGGLGMVGELLYNSAAQADNGAYGFQRMASYILGPSFDTVGIQSFNALSGASEMIADAGGADVTNAKRRSLIRGLLNRVPFLGGNKAFREKGTNLLAGDAQDTGRKSAFRGFSGSFGKGY